MMSSYLHNYRSGHSSVIDEIKEQLHGNIPDAIVVAVGGGGLLCGVCQGLHQVGWGHVPVVAMETVGCDSLNLCIREKQWTQLSDITRLPCACGELSLFVCVHACMGIMYVGIMVALCTANNMMYIVLQNVWEHVGYVSKPTGG